MILTLSYGSKWNLVLFNPSLLSIFLGCPFFFFHDILSLLSHWRLSAVCYIHDSVATMLPAWLDRLDLQYVPLKKRLSLAHISKRDFGKMGFRLRCNPVSFSFPFCNHPRSSSSRWRGITADPPVQSFQESIRTISACSGISHQFTTFDFWSYRWLSNTHTQGDVISSIHFAKKSNKKMERGKHLPIFSRWLIVQQKKEKLCTPKVLTNRDIEEE